MATSCQCIMHPYCVSFYTIYARPRMRTEDFLFFFFLPERKIVIAIYTIHFALNRQIG